MFDFRTIMDGTRALPTAPTSPEFQSRLAARAELRKRRWLMRRAAQRYRADMITKSELLALSERLGFEVEF